MKKMLFLFGFILLGGLVQAQPPKADFHFKVEYHCTWATVSANKVIPTSGISPGVYLLRVKVDKQNVMTKKILVT